MNTILFLALACGMLGICLQLALLGMKWYVYKRCRFVYCIFNEIMLIAMKADYLKSKKCNSAGNCLLMPSGKLLVKVKRVMLVTSNEYTGPAREFARRVPRYDRNLRGAFTDWLGGCLVSLVAFEEVNDLFVPYSNESVMTFEEQRKAFEFVKPDQTLPLSIQVCELFPAKPLLLKVAIHYLHYDGFSPSAWQKVVQCKKLAFLAMGCLIILNLMLANRRQAESKRYSFTALIDGKAVTKTLKGSDGYDKMLAIDLGFVYGAVEVVEPISSGMLWVGIRHERSNETHFGFAPAALNLSVGDRACVRTAIFVVHMPSSESLAKKEYRQWVMPGSDCDLFSEEEKKLGNF